MSLLCYIFFIFDFSLIILSLNPNNVMSEATDLYSKSKLNYDEFKAMLIADYKLAFESRQISILGRREVLTGKAKFGIFGDGKELAQIAMAKVFREGDWRAGYYRDQTFAFA